MKRILTVIAAICSASVLSAAVVVDKNLPAGNIKLDRIEGDTVYVQNELRDTKGWWFYWAFRVTGAEGRTLKFVFTNGDPVGTRGACVSLDKGETWNYASKDCTTKSFAYTFPADAKEVWFAMGMNYTARDWAAFLKKHEADSEFFRTGVLCKSLKGRDIETAKFGQLNGKPQYRIILTARHHANEMMASYVIEGILDAVLAKDALGEWYRRNVEIIVVPFIDKDGVEDGDQGKNRMPKGMDVPRDNNRDYNLPHAYPQSGALIALTKENSKPLDIVLDVHCPWIRGHYNEFLYQPYKRTNQERASRFGKILEAVQCGTMAYKQSDDLPFGKMWNTGGNYKQGLSYINRVLQDFPEIPLATTYEVPFATANGKTVTRETCRDLGHDTAVVMRKYLTRKD